MCLQTDNNKKSSSENATSSAHASSSNSFDYVPLLDPMADGPPEPEVQDISLHYSDAPQVVRFNEF